ncbi:MoaD/ThiS family protein [Myxococcota bacterium]|nr:MoaD/ThiS family protein [Myxococcota bacterium]
MARVIFTGGLRNLTGADSIELEAARVVDLVAALEARYPALAGKLEGATVAIDGTLHHDARYQRLRPTSEVHFLAPLAGG